MASVLRGRNLVHLLTPDTDLAELMNRGEWMTGDLVYKRMAPSGCIGTWVSFGWQFVGSCPPSAVATLSAMTAYGGSIRGVWWQDYRDRKGSNCRTSA